MPATTTTTIQEITKETTKETEVGIISLCPRAQTGEAVERWGNFLGGLMKRGGGCKGWKAAGEEKET